MDAKPRHRRPGPRSFWQQHSLSLVTAAILISWIVLYSLSSPATHLGSFFGNAIADWTGTLVMILATKYLYEKGSAESRRPRTGCANTRLAFFSYLPASPGWPFMCT